MDKMNILKMKVPTFSNMFNIGKLATGEGCKLHPFSGAMKKGHFFAVLEFYKVDNDNDNKK